jgi:hypothetical protein
MVHAVLLLLMFEAVTKDLVFTISLKRSTQNLQLSTSWAGRLHHLSGLEANMRLNAPVPGSRLLAQTAPVVRHLRVETAGGRPGIAMTMRTLRLYIVATIAVSFQT